MRVDSLRSYAIKLQKTDRTPAPNQERNPDNPAFYEYPEITVSSALEIDHFSHNTGISFTFKLGTVLKTFEDELAPETISLIDDPYILNKIETSTSDWAEAFLTETVEGQHILERIIAEHTDWNKHLQISAPTRKSHEDPRFISDLHQIEQLDENDGDRWEQNKDALDEYTQNINPLGEFLNLNLDGTHTYTIRLIDEDWNHWIYIGKTTKILQQLDKQIKQGGTFKQSKRTRMEVVNIEKITEGVQKRSQYKHAQNNLEVPENRICGV